MMFARGVVVSLWVAGISTLALAQTGCGDDDEAAPVVTEDETPPTYPPPAPQMAQLADFEGTWHCAGTRRATPLTSPYAIETTWRGKLDLGGTWLSIRVEEKETADNPTPVHGRYAMTFEQAKNQFLALWHDNYGTHSEQVSSGWQGTQLTWLGSYPMGDQVIPVRGVFHRRSPQEMYHTGEANAGGQWFVLVEETCTR